MAKGHRLNLWFQPQNFRRLTELQSTAGGLSKAKVIHNSLKLYEAVLEARLRGKDLYVIDRETGERDRIILT